MPLHPRLILALVIAAAGLAAAGFSVWRTLAKTPPQTAPEPTRPAVLAALSATRLDTRPTAESVGGVIDSAVAIAETALAAAAGIDGQADLAQAFRIQLAAVLDGDYERHRTSLAPRGVTLADVPEAAVLWNSAAAATRLAPLGLKALVVRPIYQNGRRVAPAEGGQGFGRTEYRRTLTNSHLPESPEAGGLTIVELQLPMELPTEAGGRTIALTGFRFVWHAESHKWLPWSIYLLKQPDQRPMYLPL